jgi:hypothetical protein
MKTMLSARNVFDNLKAVRTVDVDVPELGGTIRIRELTALEAREFADESKKSTGALKLLMMCAIDEEGKQLFVESDFTQLSNVGMAAVMRVQKAALKLNGLLDDEKETAAVKND